MKHLSAFLVLPLLLILCACQTKHLIPEEILQVPLKGSIYTAYTLWYENPNHMTSDNIQQGQVIPFGTEVKIESLTEKRVVFRAQNKTFTLFFDNSRMMIRMEDFIRRMFTTKTAPETAAGISPLNFEKLRRGIVDKGMSKQEVLIACGPPSPLRTPALESDTWIYLLGKVKSKRVIFKDGHVTAILTLD